MEKFCEECGEILENGICPKCNKEKIERNVKYSNNGIINRQAIKEAAKNKIKGNIWNIMLPYLLYWLISDLLTTIPYIGVEASAVNTGTYRDILSACLSFITIPLTFGVSYYVMNLVRGKSFKINDMFKYIDSRIFEIFALALLIGIFTFAWSLLLIIPGIIAAISYSMSEFIYIDNIETNPIDVIKKSKELIYGYKTDYFMFVLSFLGWFLLCILIIPAFYVIPYFVTARVMYYDELKRLKNVR